MKRWYKGFLVGCLVVVASSFTIQAPEQLARTATSTITSGINQDGHRMITTTNRRFSYVEVYPAHGGEYWMVLREEFRSELVPGIMGLPATVTVDGWAGTFPNPREKAWTIRSEGDVGEADYNFYKVTRHGCCGSLDTQVWFSLVDGQKVLTSNINPIRVELPKRNADSTRYFAWHSLEASIPPEDRETIKDLQGILQYTTERKVLQRLLVRLGGSSLSKVAIRHQGKLYDDRQALERGLWLDGVDQATGKTVSSDFSFVLTFNDHVEVEIPVENDELQIAKARVPATVILETAK